MGEPGVGNPLKNVGIRSWGSEATVDGGAHRFGSQAMSNLILDEHLQECPLRCRFYNSSVRVGVQSDKAVGSGCIGRMTTSSLAYRVLMLEHL